MKGMHDSFWELFSGVIAAIVILLILILVLICTGCKTLRNTKSSSRDSTSVNNVSEGKVRVDSSGTRSDKTSTKETVYYPQPIYVQGKDGETKVIFVPQTTKETGTEKTEQVQVIKDTSWREAFNSVLVAIANKDEKKTVKAGPSIIEWILIAGLGLFIINRFIPYEKLLIKK
jgi:hypothetical protein